MSAKRYVKFFAREMRPHRLCFAAVVLLHIILVAVTVAYVFVSKSLVDNAVALYKIVSSGSLSSMNLASDGNVQPISVGSSCHDFSSLILPSVLFVLLTVLRPAILSLRSYLGTKMSVSLSNSLRQRMFDNLLHIKNEYAGKFHSGDVINRLCSDVSTVSASFCSSIPNFIGAALQFVAAFACLLYLDARLAWILVVIIPLAVLISRYIFLRIHNLTLSIRKSDSDIQSHVQESFQHLSLLQSLEYSSVSLGNLESLQSDNYARNMKRNRFSVLAHLLLGLGFSLAYAVAFLWGAYGIALGTVTYGVMTAFLQLVGQVQRPLVQMSDSLPSLVRSAASVERLVEISDLEREDESSKIVIDGTAGIRFENVSFSYNVTSKEQVSSSPTTIDKQCGDRSDVSQSINAQTGVINCRSVKPKFVLKDFSFDFAPGSRTAVTGPTGIGKTTLIKLMMALLKPNAGRIVIYGLGGNGLDNHDYVVNGENGYCAEWEEYTVSPATRCNLVYVPQGNSLFSGTVRDNLLMGDPNADEERLREVLHTAAADFVFDLPEGLDTVCAESGVGLSEGQAQRIAIARALLRPGSVLLFDEFSSALDDATEELLMQRLTNKISSHTMIFITHRGKILDYCDSVLSL